MKWYTFGLKDWYTFKVKKTESPKGKSLPYPDRVQHVTVQHCHGGNPECDEIGKRIEFPPETGSASNKTRQGAIQKIKYRSQTY